MCPTPNCSYVHDISQLRSRLPQAFWNTKYTESRKDVLYKREQMYKDATMVEVVRYKNSFASHNYHATNKLLKTASAEYNKHLDNAQTRTPITWPEYLAECSKIRHKIEDLKKVLEQHRLDWVHTRDQLRAMGQAYAGGPHAESQLMPIYRVPCHVDGCLGLCIGNETCSVCSSQTCSKCHKKLDSDHECKQDDVETVKEITKNSKPCPTCNEAISKIEGCDQMLCTSCGTAFSWNTGKIDTGRIHNPHYYELQRRIGGARRELGDVICGGLPDWWELKGKIYLPWRIVMEKHHKLVAHIRGVVFLLFVNLDHDFNTNLKSRVRYYVKEINKSEFEKQIFKQEKKRTMKIELRDLLQTFVTVSEDVFQKIHQKQEWSFGVAHQHNPPLLKALAEHVEESELKGIFEYMIEQYKVIIRKYGSKLSLNECLKYKIDNRDGSWGDKPKVENLYANLDADLESGEKVLKLLHKKDLEMMGYVPLFEAAAAFRGARPGEVFKLGTEGLGYYRDATVQ
mgnify:FL=1